MSRPHKASEFRKPPERAVPRIPEPAADEFYKIDDLIRVRDYIFSTHRNEQHRGTAATLHECVLRNLDVLCKRVAPILAHKE